MKSTLTNTRSGRPCRLAGRLARLQTLIAATLLVLGASTATATIEVQTLTASDGAAGDIFGWDVDIDGTTLVVGAPWADIAGVVDQGAVYVFELVGGVWTETNKLTAADGVDFDQLGFSVAISGDRIVAGAEEAPIGANTSQGAAYIFERDQGGPGLWGQVMKLEEPTTIQNLAEYGHSVDIDGDWIVVGAAKAESAANGRAYVYQRDQGGPGAWGRVAELQDDITDSNAGFGTGIALDGDLLVVGAELLDKVPGSFNNEGGAYVFQRDVSNAWIQIGKLFASDATGNDRGGRGVGISGTTVVMGAWSIDGGGVGRGAAYIYDNPALTPNAWTETAILTASDAADLDYFGHAVAILDADAVVGSAGHASSRGQGYRYNADTGGVGAWDEAEILTDTGGAANDLLGYSVAMAPGYVVLGAYGTGPGKALVYAGPGGDASPVTQGPVPQARLALTAFPNPFNPSATLSFTLQKAAAGELAVYGIDGRKVRTLVGGLFTAGVHRVAWDGRTDAGAPAPSGTYFARLRAGDEQAAVKLSLLK